MWDNFLVWIGWRRKSVSTIVAPLTTIKAELESAIEHHDTQNEWHRAMAELHTTEANTAATIRANLEALLSSK